MRSPLSRRSVVSGLCACLALVGCAQAGSPAHAQTRSEAAGDDPARWEAAAPVQQAIAAARQHYEKGYAGSPVEFVPDVRVRDTATGAFTRAGAQQRAVLYQVATLSRGFPDLGLAIVEGDRLVANFAHSLLAEELDTLRGLEPDGRDAIALDGGFGMGGQYTRGSEVVVFRKEGIVDLGSVETYNDVCGMAREGAGGPTRAEVSLVPGSGLMVERFRKQTCESEAWESQGPPQPLVLDPPHRQWFVDISPRES